METSFWQRPPGWVWWLLVAGLLILVASALTLREGLRFPSRPLEVEERRIVQQALSLWRSVEPDSSLPGVLQVRLEQNLIRAMDEPCFLRAAERSTLGYTDEYGRILLNPRICFATLHCLGRVHPSDLVRTASTLVHEAQHYQHSAPEDQACQAELRFVRQAWLASTDPPWAQEWQWWQRDLLARTQSWSERPQGMGALTP